MDINFEYYKIFYFAAKYGNITKAAAALAAGDPPDRGRGAPVCPC